MGKRKKLFIAFDEEKRRDYLTGFRRRKQERRAKARLENENKLKEEIRNVKQVYHDEMKKKLESVTMPSFLADDLNVVSKRTITDTGEHTVSVEEINIAQSHYFMGENEKENADLKPLSTTNFGNMPLKKALKMNPKNFSRKKHKKWTPREPSKGRKKKNKVQKPGRRK